MATNVGYVDWTESLTTLGSVGRFLRSLSTDAPCCTSAEACAIVVPEQAACGARFLRARVPAAPLLFPATSPKLGLFRRSRGRPRRVAEKFFASCARAVNCTFSGVQRVQNYDTHLQGWASCLPRVRR